MPGIPAGMEIPVPAKTTGVSVRYVCIVLNTISLFLSFIFPPNY